MLSALFSGHDQHHVVLSNIQCFVSRAALPSHNNGLDVLHIAKFGLCDRLMSMELRQVLIYEWVEAY